MEIYVIKIDFEICEDEYSVLVSKLPEDKQTRIKRYVKHEDRLRALTSEMLIRTLISSKLGILNHNMIFHTGTHGKPYLQGVDSFHYNISHSGNFVVCAISDNPVGVDVEHIRDIDMKIADRFFSKEESQMLLMKKENDQLEYFYQLWTLKESYIKADGRGMSIPLDSFRFDINGQDILFHTSNELKNCYFRQYYIDKMYKLAVCSISKDLPENIAIKNFSYICDKFKSIR